MNIKISSFKSTLHESNAFVIENKDFILSIEKELGCSITISSLDDYDCDVKLIFIASGGSEGLFLNNIDKLKEPFYLLTKGTNNSLAASLEIMTYINLHNLKGEVLHGTPEYIANRIKSLKANKINLDTKEVVRLGVIGKPSDWLIASIPSYSDVKEKYNIDLIDISLDEVVDLYNKEPVITDISNLGYDESSSINRSEFIKAKRFSDALEKVVKKYSLSGLTIRCFDLLGSIKTTGCLGLAILNSKGIIGTCEGDIMAMISMYLVKCGFNKPSFQANPSVIDVMNKKIVFAHCTVPLSMCKKHYYLTHFESKIGVAIRGKLEKRKVGVFRISSNLKDYFFKVGVIEENLEDENLCRSQIRVKFDSPIDDLLTKPTGNHHIIFYL